MFSAENLFGWRSGCGWRFGLFNLGAFAQLQHTVRLRLLHDIRAHLILHRIKGWKSLGALVFELDDMPAKLALHRLRELALFKLESSL